MVVAPGGDPLRLQYHLIKSNLFRVIYAEGVYGGISPAAHIRATFFNERQPLPQMIEHEVSPVGLLGNEVARAGKSGIVRELEADVVMSLETAVIFHKWLGEKIEQLTAIRASFSDATTKRT